MQECSSPLCRVSIVQHICRFAARSILEIASLSLINADFDDVCCNHMESHFRRLLRREVTSCKEKFLHHIFYAVLRAPTFWFVAHHLITIFSEKYSTLALGKRLRSLHFDDVHGLTILMAIAHDHRSLTQEQREGRLSLLQHGFLQVCNDADLHVTTERTSHGINCYLTRVNDHANHRIFSVPAWSRSRPMSALQVAIDGGASSDFIECLVDGRRQRQIHELKKKKISPQLNNGISNALFGECEAIHCLELCSSAANPTALKALLSLRFGPTKERGLNDFQHLTVVKSRALQIAVARFIGGIPGPHPTSTRHLPGHHCSEGGDPHLDVPLDMIPQAAVIDSAAAFECAMLLLRSGIYDNPELHKHVHATPMQAQLAVQALTDCVHLLLGTPHDSKDCCRLVSNEKFGISVSARRFHFDELPRPARVNGDGDHGVAAAPWPIPAHRFSQDRFIALLSAIVRTAATMPVLKSPEPWKCRASENIAERLSLSEAAVCGGTGNTTTTATQQHPFGAALRRYILNPPLLWVRGPHFWSREQVVTMFRILFAWDHPKWLKGTLLKKLRYVREQQQ